MSGVYVIDLFCGCGGFSAGAALAGATVLLGVDMWQEALDVHALNHPGAEHWKTTIGDAGGGEDDFRADLWDFIERKRLEVMGVGGHLHVHASPPCTSFTPVNSGVVDREHGLHTYRFTHGTLDGLFEAGAIQSYTIENVVHRSLSDNFECVVVDMSRYGVPQTRKRSFVARGVNFGEIPEETPVTPRAIISDLYPDVDLSNKRIRAAGITFKGLPSDIGMRCTKTFDEPCYTVVQLAQRLIDKTDFTITYLNDIRVNSRLQTFPDSYEFLGNKRDKSTMIANAVPPRFAMHLVSSLASDPAMMT
jgi:DNA (cytosine-5)-methyltransferase 1